MTSWFWIGFVLFILLILALDLGMDHPWIYVKQIFVGLAKVESATTLAVVEIQD